MAAARESISPLLNNVRGRRLSLELCQKIGSHLLSPNRNNNGSGESTLASSPTTSPSKLLSVSRFQGSSPTKSVSPSQSRRGSSGCIASSPLVTASLKEFAASNGSCGDGAPANNRRRSSLTPIYSNTPSPSPSASTTSASFASSISSDVASFAIPTINVDSSEHSENREFPRPQSRCQWSIHSPRRKSLNFEDFGRRSADDNEGGSPSKLLSPDSHSRSRHIHGTKQLSDDGNEGTGAERFAHLLNSPSSFCSVIAHGHDDSGKWGSHNRHCSVTRKVDAEDGWEGNCDSNNNYKYYYNVGNNENIDPSSSSSSNGGLFLCHHQTHQRRRSFPTTPITLTSSHGQPPSSFTNAGNNTNQLDGTLTAALVAQQCPELTLSPHEVLGKGSFGTVIAAVYRGQPAAVKVIHTTSPSNRISLNGERNALRLQPHPNIARIYEIFHLGPQNQALIVMEQLRSGSLLTALNDSSVYLNGPFCIQLSSEISSALFYCHLNGILHLDVKPSNILIDFQNHCKLSDFGNSKSLQDLTTSSKFAKLDGTVAYIAPECFRGSNPTDKCDVYSFGITMWQILSRENPYQGETEHSIIYKVVAQAMRPKLTPQLHLAKFHSQETFRKYVHVYEMCWQQFPEARPNMKAVNECLLSLQRC